LSGVGGTNSGTYYVLTSSNLLVPLSLDEHCEQSL